MVKTYFKTVRRMFRHHLIRLFSLIGIILISVGFISGIGSPTDMIRDSMENYYRNQTVSDFIVKSKTGSFSEEQIAAVRSRYGEKHVNTGMSLDIQTGEKRSLRLYFLDFDAWSINVPELVDGEKVTGDGKNLVYAEAADNVIKGYSIGEEVEIDLGAALKLPMEYKITVTVQGIVRSPLTFGKDGEPSYNNPEGTEIPDNMGEIGKLDLLDNILYCPMSVLPVPVKGDLYITAQDRTLFDSFSDEYKAYVEEEKTALAGLLGDDIEVIALYDNYSFKSILSSADKVRGIGDILAIF